MVVQCTTGLFGPALIHMVAHGMYKSNLFLGSGSVLEHGLRRRDTAPMRGLDMFGHVALVAAVTAATVGASWALVRPTSFEGVPGLVFLGFVTVTVAQVASTWLRSRQERSAVDLFAFGALVVATTGSIAVAAVLKRWIAPSLPEVEPALASIGAAALASAALAGWCVAGLSHRPAGDPRRVRTRTINRAYLWAAHLGDPARVAPIPRPSEVRT
jgi:NADH:ubiquinone oxidoreductase subunit 5 (subunit L)/multisubunit Na+/H+ antiporter MnhA subunit